MPKPNIIMILIDDMGWKDLSCTGSEFYETPNIDRIRETGMMFTQGYATCPVCSPTRASLLTGKYPVNTGITDWIDDRRPGDFPYGHAKGYLRDAPYLDHLPLEEKTLAKSLKDGGYQTWHVGKWHIGREPWYPEHHGFDVNIGGCHKGSPGLSGYFSPWRSIDALKDTEVPKGTYLTDYLTDKTLELIDQRDESKPFFLNLWYYSVHTPIQAKKDKIRKYKAKAKKMGLNKLKSFTTGERFPCSHKKMLRIKRRLIQSNPVYAAMIESLDENIGRVLDDLEERGLMDNTMIVFSSDNGGLSTAEGSPTCNLPLAEGKGWMYEGGVREPYLFSWKGRIEENSSSDVPIVTTDLYPTFLEAASLPLNPEQHQDGISLLSVLEGGDAPEREAIYWHYPHYGNQGGTPGSSVLMHPWKLIEFFEDSRLELYNLDNDPGENNNVAAQNSERVKILADNLNNWQKDTHAKIPQRNKDFRPWSKSHKEKGYKPWD
jgi:arylsulfatase A-like enzyme